MPCKARCLAASKSRSTSHSGQRHGFEWIKKGGNQLRRKALTEKIPQLIARDRTAAPLNIEARQPFFDGASSPTAQTAAWATAGCRTRAASTSPHSREPREF